MANLSAAQVMALRKKTGLPMMECKEALTENSGDETAAIEWLKKKHKGKMETRSDRETGEGWVGVYISDDGTTGGIIELRCETAQVAKNDLFIALANKIAATIADGDSPSPDSAALHSALEAEITDVYGKLRETMKIGSCHKVTGESLTSYVHFDGKSGVLIAMTGKPTTDDLGKNLAMHATANKPMAVNCDGVPSEEVEKIRVAAIAQAKEDGKPDGVIDRIAEGKVNAFFSEHVLLEQEHVRSDLYGRKKVKDVLAENGVTGLTEMALVTVGG